MNPAKTNLLLETLTAACTRQFMFNPRRVAAGMRYVGTEGHGAKLIHVFRDSHTHSQIELKSTLAMLREQVASATTKGHWTDAEKARYRHTDTQIDAEIAEKRAALEYTQQSALYLDHREQLLRHCKGWPTYAPGAPTARDVARGLIASLSAAQDARLAAFAERMHTDDTEELAHLLLAPCHLEIEAHAKSAVDVLK